MKNIDAEREKELDKKAKILTFLIILGFIFSVIQIDCKKTCIRGRTEII